MSRTRSAAAGVAAPGSHSKGLLSESASNAAAAAKARHSSGAAQQAAMQQQQQQPHTSAAGCEDAEAKLPHSTQQNLLAHQGSIDENALDCQTKDLLKPSEPKADAGTASSQLPSGSHASRTRSLPPKYKAAKTRSAKPAAAKPASPASSAEHAEHAVPEQPAEHAVPRPTAEPSADPLSSTLAELAQGLAAQKKRTRHVSDAAETVSEQIDLAFDFSNDSEDSDFQPDKEPEAQQAEDEVIDLSQEDPLDVVEQPDGLVSIRSPPQAAAAAAAAAAAEASDDDEEEFQQLAGKRKQPAKAAAAKGEHCMLLAKMFIHTSSTAWLLWCHCGSLHITDMACASTPAANVSTLHVLYCKASLQAIMCASMTAALISSLYCCFCNAKHQSAAVTEQDQQRRERSVLARQQRPLWMLPWQLLTQSRQQPTRQLRKQPRQQLEGQRLLQRAKATRQLKVDPAATPMCGVPLRPPVMRRWTLKRLSRARYTTSLSVHT